MPKKHKLLREFGGLMKGAILTKCDGSDFYQAPGMNTDQWKLGAAFVEHNPDWFEEVKPLTYPVAVDDKHARSYQVMRTLYGGLDRDDYMLAENALYELFCQLKNDEVTERGTKMRSRLTLSEESATVAPMDFGKESYTMSGELAIKARDLFKTLFNVPF